MKKVALVLVAVVSLLAPNAFAHTTVKSQMTEGVRDDNALRIGHGCEDPDTGTMSGVIGQSVVFPTGDPVLTTSDPNFAVGALSDVTAQADLAGLVGAIQDRSIFLHQGTKTDATGNVIGFFGNLGYLEPGFGGRVPFQFTPPNFLADSCARQLLIKIAIADICRISPQLRAGRVNLWIPDNGSQISTAAKAAGIDGVGAPATLIVNRNLTANPLPESCGSGFSLTITPSPAQVDRDLPINKFWRVR